MILEFWLLWFVRKRGLNVVTSVLSVVAVVVFALVVAWSIVPTRRWLVDATEMEDPVVMAQLREIHARGE